MIAQDRVRVERWSPAGQPPPSGGRRSSGTPPMLRPAADRLGGAVELVGPLYRKALPG